MTDSSVSSVGLDARRRRLLFRARRRGMHEMDVIMGRFADREIAVMSEKDLDEFERLLEVPDPEILAWITGEAPTPRERDTPLLQRLRDSPAASVSRKGGA
jgi:antitoxin CptB